HHERDAGAKGHELSYRNCNRVATTHRCYLALVRRRVAAAVLLSVAIPSAARANSRLPAADQLVAAADDPTRMLLRTTFGLLFTSDGGKNWDWLCENAIPCSGNQDPAVALLNGGVVVSGQSEGLAQSPDFGCSWSFVPGTAQRLAADV